MFLAMSAQARTVKTRSDRAWDTAYLLGLGLVLLVAIGITVVARTGLRSKTLIWSDGKTYYTWARSILLDHDIDFRNDYQVMFAPDTVPAEYSPTTPKGLLNNKYPVGLAILETPGLLLGSVIARYVVHAPTNGVSAPYQYAVTWSLLALYFVSFILLYQAMLRLGVARKWACAFGLTALIGTNLFHYVVREPTMAHASGVALFNILLFLTVRWDGHRSRIGTVHGILLGALVGLLFLVRNTNVLMLPVLAAIVMTGRRVSFREVVPIAGGALVVAALQPISLWFLWGQVRFSSYINESFTAGMPGVISALVSARHGLFVYQPWYAILLLLVAYGANRAQRLRPVCLAAIASFLLMAVANGTWWCWWFSLSYGNRAFIETLPALSLVAALAVSRLNVGKRTTTALLVAMLAVVVVNLYLWVGYVLQAYPREGNHTVAQAYLWSFSYNVRSLLQHAPHWAP
jgi:hypothetical protein